MIKIQILSVNSEPSDNIMKRTWNEVQRPVVEWGPNEVCEWLDTIGLGDHKEAFSNFRCTGKFLIKGGITEDDIRDLGIVRSLQLKRFMFELKDLTSVVEIKEEFSQRGVSEKASVSTSRRSSSSRSSNKHSSKKSKHDKASKAAVDAPSQSVVAGSSVAGAIANTSSTDTDFAAWNNSLLFTVQEDTDTANEEDDEIAEITGSMKGSEIQATPVIVQTVPTRRSSATASLVTTSPTTSNASASSSHPDPRGSPVLLTRLVMMEDFGWYWVNGNGLTSFFYVAVHDADGNEYKSAADLKRNNLRLGVDYFANESVAFDHAIKLFGHLKNYVKNAKTNFS